MEYGRAMGGSDEGLLKGKERARKEKEAHSETRKKRQDLFAEEARKAKDKKEAKEAANAEDRMFNANLYSIANSGFAIVSAVQDSARSNKVFLNWRMMGTKPTAPMAMKQVPVTAPSPHPPPEPATMPKPSAPVRSFYVSGDIAGNNSAAEVLDVDAADVTYPATWTSLV